MLVHVHAIEEKFKTSLQVDPEEPIKALFPKIAVKLKVIAERNQCFNTKYHRISVPKPINSEYITLILNCEYFPFGLQN